MIFILLVLIGSLVFPLNLEIKLKENIFPFQFTEELDYKVKGFKVSERLWLVEIWQDLKFSPINKEYNIVLQEAKNVKKILKYNSFLANQNFEEILKEKEGNCISFVSYLKKKLKDLGYISEEVHGILFSEKKNNPFYLSNLKATPHRWLKVFFPEIGWVSFDPLSDNGRVTNYHLPLKEEKYLPILKDIEIVVRKWD